MLCYVMLFQHVHFQLIFLISSSVTTNAWSFNISPEVWETLYTKEWFWFVAIWPLVTLKIGSHEPKSNQFITVIFPISYPHQVSSNLRGCGSITLMFGKWQITFLNLKTYIFEMAASNLTDSCTLLHRTLESCTHTRFHEIWMRSYGSYTYTRFE